MADLTPDQANLVVSITDESTFTAAQVLSSAPVGTEGGVVTRNIPSGTQTVVGSIAQGATTSGETGILDMGAVTTAAPAYTTAQTSPLSLTTAGSLRVVDNSTVAQASTTSGEVGTLIQGAVTTAAPAYTTAQTDPLSLTTSGSLRVTDTNAVAQASTTSGEIGPLIQGAVTTANPAYTTGQTDPLSLTVAGNLRVVDSNFPATADTNFGTVGASTIRVAAEPGNATGIADFNAGATGAQTLRVAANQGAPNTVANAWPIEVTNGTNTAAVKAASAAPLATDPALVVSESPNKTATYSAAIVGLATAATATDIFTLTGSATKTIRLHRISISANQTTQSWEDVVLLKRSTADTAGTSTSPTIVSFDSNNPAATATVNAYTANPTLGTLVGIAKARKLYVPQTASGGNQVGAIDYITFDFGEFNFQPVILRGTTQVFAVNLNSVTWAGSSVDIDVEWSEE